MVRGFITILAFSGSLAWAAPQSKQQYCEIVAQGSEAIKALANDSENLMAFQNWGGLFGGGVCWWHSLFQRSALYLTVYRPDLPPPTDKRAKAIVHLIASGRRVVEIPGYRNFRDFSRVYEDLIQAKLEQWQLIDGFLKFEWIRGLSGQSSMPTERLERQLLKVDREVKKSGDILWTMLQMPGIAAHAWLVFDTAVQPERIDFNVLDSNYPRQLVTRTYQHGDEQIDYGVPYLGRNRELNRFKEAALAYCSGVSMQTLGMEEYFAEIDPLDNDLE